MKIHASNPDTAKQMRECLANNAKRDPHHEQRCEDIFEFWKSFARVLAIAGIAAIAYVLLFLSGILWTWGDADFNAMQNRPPQHTTPYYETHQ